MTNAREASHRISVLLKTERSCLADFLVALAAFDAERGWAELGYRSLHQYLERELKLSGGPAFYRVTAARLIQKIPSVVEPLRSGELCLTAIHAVSQVLAPENERELLPRFFGLSRERAEELVAALRPAANVPEREVVTACAIAAAPAPSSHRSAARADERRAGDETLVLTAAAPERTSRVGPEWVPAPAQAAVATPPTRERDEVEPLTGELRRLHTTVSKKFLAKLQAAKDALSHSIPDGDTEAVLSTALDLLLEKTAKRRGLVKKPRPAPAKPSSDPRHIPAAVAREVWKRDGERCSVRLPDGSLCGSTVRLQLDHVTPVALGGASTVDNLRVACAAHNQLAARRVFGNDWMDQYTGRADERRAAQRLPSTA